LRSVSRFITGGSATVVQFPPSTDAFCCKTNGDDGTVHEIETDPFAFAGAISNTGAGAE